MSLLGGGPATIADNVITGNTSSASGGGIDVNGGGSSVIERNVITGNTSGYGGGISVVNTMSPVFRNNLIAGNTASSDGGGIAVSVPFGGGSPQFRNNTIVDNTGLTGPGISVTGWLATTSDPEQRDHGRQRRGHHLVQHGVRSGAAHPALERRPQPGRRRI